MLLIIVAVFLAVFAITAVVLMSSGAGVSTQLKRTLEKLDAISVRPAQDRADEPTIVLREELLSSIPWVDRWLRSIDVFGRLRKLLRQADLKWTVATFCLLTAAGAVAAGTAVYLRTRGLALTVPLAAAGASLPLLWALQKRYRRFNTFEQMMPEALDLIVSALRAGHGLTSALATVAKEMPDPIGVEFGQCFSEQNFGLELRAAMLNLAERVPTQDVRIVVTAILVHKESGGNLAEILEKVAHIIRERFRLKRQVRVHTAQGRLTGWILAVLPVVLGVALYLVKPDAMRVLWTKPLGIRMLYGAGVMTVIGGLIIRKIVQVKV
jgi:tight adherence protein B